MTTTMNPTEAQRAAIESHHPRILALAGPGSGKTTTLLARLARLIDDGCPPERIVCITFTNAAAQEMAKRLEAPRYVSATLEEAQTAAKGAPFPAPPRLGYLGTLHGFALNQLQRYGAPLGYSDRITVLDQEQADAMLLSIAKDMGAKGGIKKLQQAREDLRIGSKPRSPEELAVAAYLKRLRADSACDFETILTDFLELLKRPEPGLRPTWAHLIVDEYQDSGALDAAIYEAIPAENRFFVGDGDQAIYGFRGGRVENIIDLGRGDRWEIHIMEGNFRCGPAICDAANTLIRNNKFRVPKYTLSTRPKAASWVQIHAAPTDDAERVFIVENIATRLADGAAPNETAVLCRGNVLALEITKALEGRGIPVRKKKSQWVPDDWPRARAALEFLNAPMRELTARQWLRAKLGEPAADKAERDAKRAQVPLWQNVPNHPGRPATMATIETDLARLGISRESIELVMAKAAGIPNPDLAAVSFALGRDLEAAPEIGDGVTVTTIHSAKGREWQVVYVAGCEQELCPGLAKTRNVEEERRLFFVAITRAKSWLILTHAASRRQPWGLKRQAPCQPSQFLAEISA